MRRLTQVHRLVGLLLIAVVATAILPFSMQLAAPNGSDAEQTATTLIRPRAAKAPATTRQVYGYLPWWSLNAGTAGRLRFDLLTTIAFFGIGITPSGALDRRGLGYLAFISPDAVRVTNAAHARGVRVVPTFQLFDGGSLHDLRAFLGHSAAQARFIREAVSLVASRGADGANLDIEPVPSNLDGAFVAFAGKFRAALRARIPGATLVVATSPSAPTSLIRGLAGRVDQLFVMAYDYRTVRSSTAGPVAPLDGSGATVSTTVARYLAAVPASKVILGVPYYGYDWPVTNRRPNAPVRPASTGYGSAFSISYAAVTSWLSDHPTIPVRRDAVAASAYFTYHDHDAGTYRQVWFDDARSLAAKYDLAITEKLAGIGIWALDNDRGYAALWTLLDQKFGHPVHRVVVAGSVNHVNERTGQVEADLRLGVFNRGTVPEAGILRWTVRTPAGAAVVSGHTSLSVAARGARRPVIHIVVGWPGALPRGTFTVQVSYSADGRRWSPARQVTFRQPYH